MRGPKGNACKVLTATPAGAELARRQAVGQGLDSGQRTWAGLVKPGELAHDTEVYRAAREEVKRLLADQATIRRIRIDAELKSIVAKRSETARARDGKAAADIEWMQAARNLGLPVDDNGKVHYPDVQIEYTDADGRTDHVHVEVATNDYRNRAIQAKAAAGFVIHGNGCGGARVSADLDPKVSEASGGREIHRQAAPGGRPTGETARSSFRVSKYRAYNALGGPGSVLGFW